MLVALHSACTTSIEVIAGTCPNSGTKITGRRTECIDDIGSKSQWENIADTVQAPSDASILLFKMSLFAISCHSLVMPSMSLRFIVMILFSSARSLDMALFSAAHALLSSMVALCRPSSLTCCHFSCFSHRKHRRRRWWWSVGRCYHREAELAADGWWQWHRWRRWR